MQRPRVLGWRRHRGKPDLPINPRLIWRDERWTASRIAGLGFKLVLFPFGFSSNQLVICPLENNFVAFAPYCPECAVRVDEIKRIIRVIHQLPAGGEIEHSRYAEPDHHNRYRNSNTVVDARRLRILSRALRP